MRTVLDQHPYSIPIAKLFLSDVASAPMQKTLAIVLLSAFTFASTTYAVVTNDITCLRSAASERTEKLKRAYDKFAEDMKIAADRLRDDESNRLEYGDIQFRQNEIARIYTNYTHDLGERSRDLSAKLTEAWNEYQRQRNLCYASATPDAITPAYIPPNYGAPSYGTQYGNPYYGTSAYGGYGNSYYGSSYYRGAAGGCPSRPLSQPPPGCGYQYGTDSNGCPSYTPVCNNALSNTSPCTCPASYAPVCSRDGQTYFNACYAACMGARVQFQGVCGGY